MSTNKTTHYALHSWVPDDEFHLTEINENFAALDAALKAEADTSAEQISALQSTVNTKASAAELNALKTTVAAKADSATVSALQSAVNGKATTAALNAAKAEIPHFLTGTYAGTGSAVTVNLGVAPKVVLVVSFYGGWFNASSYKAFSCMAFPNASGYQSPLVVTSTGFTATNAVSTDLTDKNTTYYYWVWY